MKKNKGAIISAVVTVLALAGVCVAFLTTASPYVTVAEARLTKGDNLHVAGDLVKETLATDVKAKQMTFSLKDEKGEKMDVVYSGPPPANMGSATKVVAIGGMEGDAFHAHKLLVKCPSKYESEKK